MSDWNLFALIIVFNGLAMLYAWSEPPWLVQTWKQIRRPVDWVARKVSR